MEKNFSFETKAETEIGTKNRERASLSVDTLKDAPFSGLLQPFLYVADTDSLPLEGGGVHTVIIGIRITCILVAGKDEGGR